MLILIKCSLLISLLSPSVDNNEHIQRFAIKSSSIFFIENIFGGFKLICNISV